MKYREYTKKSTGEMRIVCDVCGAPTSWKTDRTYLAKWRDNHVCPDMSKYNNIRF
jgi:hypothetical protein